MFHGSFQTCFFISGTRLSRALVRLSSGLFTPLKSRQKIMSVVGDLKSEIFLSSIFSRYWLMRRPTTQGTFSLTFFYLFLLNPITTTLIIYLKELYRLANPKKQNHSFTSEPSPPPSPPVPSKIKQF